MVHDPSFHQRLHQAQRLAAEFPRPQAAAQLHSDRLQQHIREEIARQGGAIPFQQFMQLALYAPASGYYSAGSRKLGAAGDFITAPETSALFSRTLARGIAPALSRLPEKQLFEIGAGSGVMARDMLAELAAMECLPDAYRILELSADLIERQQQCLADPPVPVAWLESLPENFSGIVLANELLDAMPVHRVVWQGGRLEECYVGWESDAFVWQTGPLTDKRLQFRFDDICERVGELPEGYLTEINLLAEDWLHSIGKSLQQGLVLLIDYGYPRHEYYHPQRSQGSLMCHYRHRAHDDPFAFPGLQDITAHVDFTAIADAALASGMKVTGYTTQAHFLLGSGLTELAAACDPADAGLQLDIANQVRRLTLPQGMGELFKVMVLTKDLDVSLPGLMLCDLRGKL